MEQYLLALIEEIRNLRTNVLGSDYRSNEVLDAIEAALTAKSSESEAE